MKKTVELYIETKKGHIVRTRWVVTQLVPYPDIERGHWRNGEGVFPQWGNPAGGIGRKYQACLLAQGVTEVPDDYNRKVYAGFDGNAGTFAYRGTDLGEISVELGRNPHGCYTRFTVRGYDTPTPGERDFLDSHITHQLAAFIDSNKAALYDEAVATIEKTLAERTAEMRKDADKLDKEAAIAVAALRKDKP